MCAERDVRHGYLPRDHSSLDGLELFRFSHNVLESEEAEKVHELEELGKAPAQSRERK